MKFFAAILSGAMIALFSQSAVAACKRPPEPTTAGAAKMTRAEILNVVREVKKFQAALMDFRQCLDQEKLALGEEITEDQFNAYKQRYDASVDIEQKVADAANAAIRAYKAANAKK